MSLQMVTDQENDPTPEELSEPGKYIAFLIKRGHQCVYTIDVTAQNDDVIKDVVEIIVDRHIEYVGSLTFEKLKSNPVFEIWTDAKSANELSDTLSLPRFCVRPKTRMTATSDKEFVVYFFIHEEIFLAEEFNNDDIALIEEIDGNELDHTIQIFKHNITESVKDSLVSSGDITGKTTDEQLNGLIQEFTNVEVTKENVVSIINKNKDKEQWDNIKSQLPTKTASVTHDTIRRHSNLNRNQPTPGRGNSTPHRE